MSNILQHNRNIFDIKIDRSNYWDFHLCIDGGNSLSENTLSNCLSVDIDFNNNECVLFDNVLSKLPSAWLNAKNENGLILNSIGMTGVDNGLFTYEKDRITNKEFLEIFFNSKYNIEPNDIRFKLNKIKGNNKIYNYENDVVILDDGIRVAKLNGGFYQGFFKIEGKDYHILPTSLGTEGWCFSFTLNKKDFINENYTLNTKYPENKGIFFYIGTRAENKWWNNYIIKDLDYLNIKNEEFPYEYSQEYVKETNDNIDYFAVNVEEREDYFSDNYIKKNDYVSKDINCCDYYVSDEYIEQDVVLPKIEEVKTEEGYDIAQPNIIEIKTDNKFITYNRTKEGFTTKDNVDDTQVILYDIKTPDIENYFILFDRTKNGYTTKTINKLIKEKSLSYKILDDLYRNALAFQITDEGKIGYKYLVKDCDNENNYKILSEFSNSIINNNEWNVVDVKIKPLKNISNNCDINRNDAEMRLYFYVNGNLVLVSKPLPILKLRPLNDLPSKQEGVPYNISIGGGTQGLCDTVSLNYTSQPKEALPLEKEFGGSFIGYIKSFKFYTCNVNYSFIENNVENEINLLK